MISVKLIMADFTTGKTWEDTKLIEDELLQEPTAAIEEAIYDVSEEVTKAYKKDQQKT